MSPFAPNDADTVLADFGETITCEAVPSVTRALLDDMVQAGEIADQRVVSQTLVMKVKRGAFGTTRVQDTRVTLVDRGNARYKIDAPMPHDTSLFDHFVLAPVR